MRAENGRLYRSVAPSSTRLLPLPSTRPFYVRHRGSLVVIQTVLMMCQWDVFLQRRRAAPAGPGSAELQNGAWLPTLVAVLCTSMLFMARPFAQTVRAVIGFLYVLWIYSRGSGAVVAVPMATDLLLMVTLGLVAPIALSRMVYRRAMRRLTGHRAGEDQGGKPEGKEVVEDDSANHSLSSSCGYLPCRRQNACSLLKTGAEFDSVSASETLALAACVEAALRDRGLVGDFQVIGRSRLSNLTSAPHRWLFFPLCVSFCAPPRR